MMQLLLPLGLLGLLGVLALIIIYIIRPNYQTRHINSTFVWKLSLKYKKRRLPTSKLRNILIFLCQVLILTAMSLIMTQPAIVYQAAGDENELIAIIDSSMSMYTETTEGETRFDRALDLAAADFRNSDIIAAGGRVSVIIADDSPFYYRTRVSPAGAISALTELKEGGEEVYHCSYGSADFDAAMRLSEETLAANPYARIRVYTDKTFQYTPEDITVVPGARVLWHRPTGGPQCAGPRGERHRRRAGRTRTDHRALLRILRRRPHQDGHLPLFS